MTLNEYVLPVHECEWCGHQLTPDNVGCLEALQVEVHAARYPRIKWGDGPERYLFEEARDGTDMPWPWPCPGCKAGVGTYHHVGCEVEDCPHPGCTLPLWLHATPVRWIMPDGPIETGRVEGQPSGGNAER